MNKPTNHLTLVHSAHTDDIPSPPDDSNEATEIFTTRNLQDELEALAEDLYSLAQRNANAPHPQIKDINPILNSLFVYVQVLADSVIPTNDTPTKDTSKFPHNSNHLNHTLTKELIPQANDLLLFTRILQRHSDPSTRTP